MLVFLDLQLNKMNQISTLFEPFLQKLAANDWHYFSSQVLDQPITTLIFISIFALIHIVGRIKTMLNNHKNICFDIPQAQSWIKNQASNQLSNSTTIPIETGINNSKHEQFDSSPQKPQPISRYCKQQPKQEKTRIISNKAFIQLLKKQKHQAKIKQVQQQNRLLFLQKIKKKTHQRNQLVYQQIKDTMSKLFNRQIYNKNTKDAQSKKQPEDSEKNIPQFTKQNNSAPKHTQINIQQKQQLQKQYPKIDTSQYLKHINNQSQFLEAIITFASAVKSTTEITTTMSNLGGARSSLPNLLIFAKSFISTINLSNDNEVTALAIKIYNSIVFTLIRNSNLRDGVQRIPPKSKSSQVEKNSINSYILIINIYRLMGVQKIWLIVFGRLLKLLEFIYKRTEQLNSHEELQLIVKGYIQKKGEISSRYLSRLDYLSYLLLGLTTFDPLLIWDLNIKTDTQIIKSKQEMISWNKTWSYKQFWILVSSILKNKNQFYFKPILYMNIMSVLYPRIYMNKLNSQSFKQELNLYEIVLNKSKEFFLNYKNNQEIQTLSKNFIGTYEYDGQDFKEGIKVLQNRIMIQKNNQIKLNAEQFRNKANIFYYFCKEN